MADRDAFIVICWLAILALMFFECFYRKLKKKFNRDVQSPRSFSTTRSIPSQEGFSDLVTCSLVPPYQPPSHLDRNNNHGEGDSASSSVGSSSKEMFLVTMEFGREEEPPPSYDEALSYARLDTKFRFLPYGNCEIPSEIISSSSQQHAVGATRGGNSFSVDERHRSRDCIASAKNAITITTAASSTAREKAGISEEEESGSSEGETDVELDTETLLNGAVQGSRHHRTSPNEHCKDEDGRDVITKQLERDMEKCGLAESKGISV